MMTAMVQVILPINGNICAFKCHNYLRLTLAHCQGKGQGSPFIYSEYLRNGERQKKHYYCHQIGSYVLAFDKHIHICPWLILKVKVKIMDISAVNILEMVTEAKLLFKPNSKVWFSITIFTLDLDPFESSWSRSFTFQQWIS